MWFRRFQKWQYTHVPTHENLAIGTLSDVGVSRFGRRRIPAELRVFSQDGRINNLRPPLGRIVISWQTAGDLKLDLKVLAINATIKMVEISSSVLSYLDSRNQLISRSYTNNFWNIPRCSQSTTTICTYRTCYFVKLSKPCFGWNGCTSWRNEKKNSDVIVVPKPAEHDLARKRVERKPHMQWRARKLQIWQQVRRANVMFSNY